MSTTLFSAAAILLYLFAAAWWIAGAARPEAGAVPLKARLLYAGAAALVLHAIVLYRGVLTAAGLDLGFYNALSLMSWVIALLVVAVATVRPAENLALVFLPAAALALLLEQIFASERIISGSAGIGLQMHIVLSIGAYAVLAIAAVQSVVLAIQERLLRSRQPVQAMRLLPPLQSMETLLVQILAAGFFLLSLSLATGLMFVQDLLTQHLAHKTTFSILAWLIFGAVLAGRWTRGWRGRLLIRWTLGGFLCLVLAYFGTKFVLELVLHRV
jgi:ABC-type uncharacterized transport system permease subunit